mmetsp:Transcript_33270/g.74123  ORF Transcript_33270/g.74123 Transcript_33270/m.74123 type:complete len:208 (+) Transcript_33270:443-1066(+)
MLLRQSWPLYPCTHSSSKEEAGLVLGQVRPLGTMRSAVFFHAGLAIHSSPPEGAASSSMVSHTSLTCMASSSGTSAAARLSSRRLTTCWRLVQNSKKCGAAMRVCVSAEPRCWGSARASHCVATPFTNPSEEWACPMAWLSPRSKLFMARKKSSKLYAEASGSSSIQLNSRSAFASMGTRESSSAEEQRLITSMEEPLCDSSSTSVR